MPKRETDLEIFAKLCRYNSSRHFLDSGDTYGRHFEKPAINLGAASACTIEASRWQYRGESYRNEICGTLETAHFLAEAFEVKRRMNANFKRWANKQETDENWYELAERYMSEKRGMKQSARDNTYNGENDLTQVYVWEVYQMAENRYEDWIYDHDAITVIYVHTGCDVRGGYSPPIFCRAKGEYTVPFDLVAEFYVIDAVTPEGERLTGDHGALQGLGDEWRAGNSDHPSSLLSGQLERVFPWTATKDTVIAKLKSGHIVKIGVSMPYLG